MRGSISRNKASAGSIKSYQMDVKRHSCMALLKEVYCFSILCDYAAANLDRSHLLWLPQFLERRIILGKYNKQTIWHLQQLKLSMVALQASCCVSSAMAANPIIGLWLESRVESLEKGLSDISRLLNSSPTADKKDQELEIKQGFRGGSRPEQIRSFYLRGLAQNFTTVASEGIKGTPPLLVAKGFPEGNPKSQQLLPRILEFRRTSAKTSPIADQQFILKGSKGEKEKDPMTEEDLQPKSSIKEIQEARASKLAGLEAAQRHQTIPSDQEVHYLTFGFELETEEESTMALELIKFVKQQLEEFEDSDDDDLAKSDHEEAERV
ncbi:hypothetical protein Tco_0006815 [Tanacetum coccineum]